MKQIISIFLVIIMVFNITWFSFATDEPIISVSSASAMPGDVIQLPVEISGNPGINTFSLGFEIDSDKLQLLEVKKAAELGGQFVYKKKAVWLSDSDTLYNGQLLILKLKVIDQATDGISQVKITYAPGDIANYQEQDVYFSVEPGFVFVGINEETLNELAKLIKQMLNLIKKITRLTSFHRQM